MTTTLVTGTAEHTGKTAVALALALAARERGESVGYMKPLGTRLRSTVGKTRDEDPMLARELLETDDTVADMEPVVYTPTFVEEVVRGREDPDAVRERVREAYETVAADRDRVVVEAGGDRATGGAVDLDHADVAELLDAEVVVVAPFGEARDVDPVLAAAEAFGDRLAGVLFNAVPDAALDRLKGDVVGFLQRRGVPVVGVVGRQADLAGVPVAELARELGADVLTADAPTDGVVERFQVGAMGAEAALAHFRRTSEAAVVTGGDRADVQTAALQAPGVNCLVLTGGHRPSGSVLGRAEEAGVPVLLVDADTVTTIERVEGVLSGGRTRDAHTVRRMQELLAEHADVDAMLGGR